MKISFAVVMACLVVAASAVDLMYFADQTLVRTMTLADGTTSIVGTSKQPTRTAIPNQEEFTGLKGLVDFTLGADGNLYALSAKDSQIWKYVTANGATTVSVFVGSAGAGVVDGTADVAKFAADASAMTALADGTFLLADVTNNQIRKVSPAGTVSPYVGVAGTSASTDGLGTNANIINVKTMVTDSMDNVYFLEGASAAVTGDVIKKLTPDGTVSTVAGKAANAQYAKVENIGTNALLSAEGMTLSKDEKSIYFSSSTTNVASGAASVGIVYIRKLDIASKQTSLVLDQVVAASAVCVDGVGTSAILCPISKMITDIDGNLIFNQVGVKGEVMKMLNVTSLAVTTIAGSSTAVSPVMNPSLGTVRTAADAVTLVDGTGTSASFVIPRGFAAFQSVCGKLSKLGANVTISSGCDELTDGGSIPKLIIANGATKITKALIITDALNVNTNGKLTCAAPLSVANAIVFAGNGTLVINDVAVTADSVAFSADSVYQVLIQNASPKFLTVTNAAALAGTIVVTVGKDFLFDVGTTASVLAFGSRGASGFAKVFLVKLRTTVARRSLLQAAGAAVNCGATSCAATGTKFSGDDDDEVGLIVALAIVGTMLALVLCGACFLVMKKTSDKNVEQIVAGQTAKFDSYSSSSSSSEFGQFGDFDYYEYDY